MRIQSVTAHAFGPLHDETLSLGEGMTVVVGDNESAKSSWHAAIFAALCGRRRGKGKPRADERHFIELHKPWNDEDWLVTARIHLDDGRDIELRQDLAGKVDCHAKDLVLGRDVSSEIMNDGAPDSSTWLGLDRSSFGATACVEQGQMRRVRDDAEGLQEHLQRAAATAGAASTAVKALERIDDYSRERVGLDRINSTKPLRTAQERLQRAQHELDERTAAHDEYLSRVDQVEKLRQEAAAAAAAVHAHEAAAAAESATHLKTRADRARDLSARHGDTAPASALDDAALAGQVSEALTQWRSRPATPVLPEPSSTQLREEIDTLPEVPQGDTEAHPSVQRAVERLRRASAQRELHDRSRPSQTVGAPQVAAGDDELLDLARALQAPALSVPPELVAREEKARAAAATQGRGRSSTMLIGVGMVAAMVGLMLLAIVDRAVGAAIAVAGAGLCVAGVARHSGGNVSAARVFAEAQAALQAAQKQTAEREQQREQAAARCAQIGIPADPAALREVPAARARATAQQQSSAKWADQQAVLQDEATAAAAELGDALAARGQTLSCPDQSALLAAAENYRQDCNDRAAQATQAVRRADLMRQLSGAEAAERRATEDDRGRARAADLILAAAEHCGTDCVTAQDAAAALQTWQEQRSSRFAELAKEQEEWAELQALLDNKPLAELEESSRAASARAQALADAADPQLLASAGPTAAETLTELRHAAAQAKASADTEEGELRQLATNIGSVAEAEEDLTKAQDELHRVLQLKETLELTREFLENAQSRVYRDIAPALAGTLKDWLPRLTDGRYTDVIVDPESLLVQVCGGSRQWRKADLLSYGTAEQVYLLLRVALADHLTKDHDTCPLLLDDVTVHADAARTASILDLLLQIAADRQVVVFTQEDQVAAWARDNLTSPRNAIHELTPIPAA